jgi:hypothetical protein
MKLYEFANTGLHDYIASVRVDGVVVDLMVQCRNSFEARRVVIKLFGSNNVINVREVVLSEYGATNAKSNWSSETQAVNALMDRGKKASETAKERAAIGQKDVAAGMRDEAKSLKRQGRALRARNKMNKAWHELMKNQPGAGK